MVHIQEYTFKKGYSAEKERILAVLKECFPCEIKEDEDKFILSYGAIKEMVVLINGKLHVDTKPNLKVSDDVIMDTNKRFRDFWKRRQDIPQSKGLAWLKRKRKNDVLLAASYATYSTTCYRPLDTMIGYSSQYKG